MPKTKTVPGVGDVQFPDSMSDADIQRAIQRDIIPNATPASAGPARYPGDPISQREARRTNPPATAHGDPSASSGLTTADVLTAGLHGVGGLVKGLLTFGLGEPDDAEQVADSIPQDQSGDTRAQAVLRERVPIVGDPIADVMKPSVAYAQGRPPTKEENISAIESGTSLAGQILLARQAAAKLSTADQAIAFYEEKIAKAPTVEAKAAYQAELQRAVGDRAPAAPTAPAEAVAAAVAQRAAPGERTAEADRLIAREAPAAPGDAPAETRISGEQPAPAPMESPTGFRAAQPSELPPVADSEFGAALRTLHTGERDVRIAEANNLALDIRKALPNHIDREALTLMRDFRNNAAQLEAFATGMDPAYDGMPGGEKTAVLDQMQKLRPAMERALNPTEAMKAADAKLTDYFGKTLQEGRDLGFLDSTIAPEDYVNHLLLPADAEPGTPRIGPSGVNRYTPFAKGRFYPTVLDAVANGVKVRTLDAADALSIYGDKHGTAAATRVLIDTMKQGDIGKFATASTAPQGWAEVGPGTRLFRNEVGYLDSEGNPGVAHQAFYAPKKIADALRPLTDADYSSTIPGFTKTKLYQQYVKSVELGLSVFHIRALNLSALGNEGITGLVKSYAADMESAAFRDVEATMLRHGGTTSITGRTFEAYRAARETSLPTRLDVVRNLPVFKQFDQVAAATSHLTFDVMQRKFKVTDFCIKDAKWIADHPNATPAELAKARRGIAKEVNAVYGGLNWEALGVNKLTHSAAKAFFLAPDWTFSNWQNAKTAFTGGPGGAAARAFWVRSAVTGAVLTQLTSLLLSGKKSDDPTSVYLGQDHHGNDVYQNLFFAGAPSDMVGLIKNVHDYGAIGGTARSIAAKLAPITRTGVQLLTNRNYLGQEIAKRGSGIAGDVRTAAHIVTQLAPVPFSAANMVQMEASNIASGQQPAPDAIRRISHMLGDKTKDYTPTEFITTLAGGTTPRHVPHWKMVRAGNHQVPPPDGQRRYGELENEDMLTRTSPLAWLPDRFKSARDARVGSPFPPGAHNPSPTDPFRDTIGYEEGTAPPGASADAPRWRGRFGFNVQDSAGMPEHQLAEISKAAGSSAPETMVHELMHGAYEDLTDQELATIDRLHIATVRASDRVYATRGRISTTAVPLAERIAHEPEFHNAPHEWFSEVAAMYVANPSWLKESDPGVYGVLRKIFGREYIQAAR